jgi:uncharacterized coiled-coil protein SlyX
VTIEERCEDLEIKLAFQDKLVRELDELVRALAERLVAAERELKTLKDAIVSPANPLGGANEPPPHY